MTENNRDILEDTGNEQYPIEPRCHPANIVLRRIYDFLASARLAITLLVIILICCVLGVTVWREVKAGEMIFGTLWFNGLLVLLVVNVACCFFGRIWGRKLTVLSFGMILFHLSFVAVFLGVVFNSLFYFRGIIRLTEGESLPSGDTASYDSIDKGRYFSFDRLQGSTTLIKMHTDFKVDGKDKRMAYQVAVGQPGSEKQGMLYITHKLDVAGVNYFNDKEGYAPLLTLSDGKDAPLYGMYIPLQSLKNEKNEYLYTTGTKDAPGVVPFPNTQQPLYAVQLVYIPSKLNERGGEAILKIHTIDSKGELMSGREPVEKKVKIGESITVGEHKFTVKEVRYWVAMFVRYEPGKPIVLTSLWVGLAGMVITMAGRIMRGSGKKIQGRDVF